jgi:hypothetical protein
MSVRRSRLVVAVAFGLISANGARVLGAQAIPVRAGVVVSPDTVRVGDPFRVSVGIRAPKGATIEFPAATDSTSTVQSLDPPSMRMSVDTGAVEQYAEYRVAAWDVGRQPIRFDDAIVRFQGGMRRIPLGGQIVFVKSVLPADSAQRVPKPQRSIFEPPGIPWWVWLLLAMAIVALGQLLWWWWKRRRRPVSEAVLVEPFERAEAEFARIERLGLIEAGERGRHVALTVEVLRDYLAARFAEASLSNTSSELQKAVRRERTVPHDRLTRLLVDADLVKFARRPVSGERARDLGREARAIVGDEHGASQPPTQAAA